MPGDSSRTRTDLWRSGNPEPLHSGFHAHNPTDRATDGQSVDRKGRAEFAGGDVPRLQEPTVLSSKNSHPRPAGHVRVAATAIGSLSILLAVGLGLLGILARVNGLIAKGLLAGTFPKALHGWLVWMAAVIFAFGLPLAILSVPGTWRRLVLWITAVVVVAGWAPVLSLAAHAPEIAAPFIATVWSGVCALVYTANHRMACDHTIRFASTDTADETR